MFEWRCESSGEQGLSSRTDGHSGSKQLGPLGRRRNEEDGPGGALRITGI